MRAGAISSHSLPYLPRPSMESGTQSCHLGRLGEVFCATRELSHHTLEERCVCVYIYFWEFIYILSMHMCVYVRLCARACACAGAHRAVCCWTIFHIRAVHPSKKETLSHVLIRKDYPTPHQKTKKIRPKPG